MADIQDIFALIEPVISIPFKTSKIRKVNLSGQTVLITGGSSGLGFEAAKHFVNLGARVILAVRSLPKGEAKREELLDKCNNNDAEVDIRELDMSSFASIKNFARSLDEGAVKLDIVILNAGIYQLEFSESSYGYEMQLQVNTLGTVLLGLLLLPVLHRSGAALAKPVRLLVVTSEGHAHSNFSEATKPDVYRVKTQEASENHTSSQAHHLSKLFLVLLVREIAERVDSTKIIVGHVSPGYCNTNLYHDIKGTVPDLLKTVLGRSAVSGAKSYIYAVLSSEDKFHKGYFRNARLAKTSKYTCNNNGRAFGRELWTQTLEVLNAQTPGGVDVQYLPLNEVVDEA